MDLFGRHQALVHRQHGGSLVPDRPRPHKDLIADDSNRGELCKYTRVLFWTNPVARHPTSDVREWHRLGANRPCKRTEIVLETHLDEHVLVESIRAGYVDGELNFDGDGRGVDRHSS